MLCGLIIDVTEIAEFSVEDEMTIIRERVSWQPTNTIERFDTNRQAKGWASLDIPMSPLTPRRTPGAVQVNSFEILIFGGVATGK